MKRNWDDIKWIFKPDGALRDIYVQEASLNDWEKIIDLINEKYKVQFGGIGENQDKHQIDKSYVVEYLTNDTGALESKFASVLLGKIRLNCHFFLADQIEFDLSPGDVNSIEDFELIENFMVEISKVIDRQITLTDENSPTFPLVKIDFNRGINKILTKDEVRKLGDNSGFFSKRINLIKTIIYMKLMPKKFTEKILTSANEPYRATKKNENKW